MAKVNGLWDVQGKFILPGTRDTVSFGPVRISAESRAQASRDVTPLLQREFGRKAMDELHLDRRAYTFSPAFALMNLQFTPRV